MFGIKLNKYDIIFTHLKLWVAVARHNFKWVKIKIINCYWEWNVSLNIQQIISKYPVLNETNISNFYPLEVVGRDSETQLQVGEN